MPEGEAKRRALAEEIGQQGKELLDALFDSTAPQWLRQIPAVEILRKVWVQNYHCVDTTISWRASKALPPLLVRERGKITSLSLMAQEHAR